MAILSIYNRSSLLRQQTAPVTNTDCACLQLPAGVILKDDVVWLYPAWIIRRGLGGP